MRDSERDRTPIVQFIRVPYEQGTRPVIFLHKVSEDLVKPLTVVVSFESPGRTNPFSVSNKRLVKTQESSLYLRPTRLSVTRDRTLPFPTPRGRRLWYPRSLIWPVLRPSRVSSLSLKVYENFYPNSCVTGPSVKVTKDLLNEVEREPGVERNGTRDGLSLSQILNHLSGTTYPSFVEI